MGCSKRNPDSLNCLDYQIKRTWTVLTITLALHTRSGPLPVTLPGHMGCRGQFVPKSLDTRTGVFGGSVLVNGRGQHFAAPLQSARSSATPGRASGPVVYRGRLDVYHGRSAWCNL